MVIRRLHPGAGTTRSKGVDTTFWNWGGPGAIDHHTHNHLPFLNYLQPTRFLSGATKKKLEN